MAITGVLIGKITIAYSTVQIMCSKELKGERYYSCKSHKHSRYNKSLPLTISEDCFGGIVYDADNDEDDDA
jgi:hypothetical protein